MARRSDAEAAGRRAERARQMPERWAAIWCSQATRTPSRDAIRTARSGSHAPTSMAGTPIGETATGIVGARAATPAAIVASALIAALHSHSESSPHSVQTTSNSSSEARDSANSSDSAGDHRRPASRARSRRQAPRARRSDHGPPSPGAGENSWRYSPEPRQITGVIDRSIAVSPTTALPSRASRPTLALSGSGVRCPRRPRRLRRTPPDQSLHQPAHTNQLHEPIRHISDSLARRAAPNELPTSSLEFARRARLPDHSASELLSPVRHLIRSAVSLTGPGNPRHLAPHSSAELPTSDQISCYKFGRR